LKNLKNISEHSNLLWNWQILAWIWGRKSVYNIAFEDTLELCNSRQGHAVSNEFSQWFNPCEKCAEKAKLVVGGIGDS
jgi:hypothetical protein